jgi:hypothetical protein
MRWEERSQRHIVLDHDDGQAEAIVNRDDW